MNRRYLSFKGRIPRSKYWVHYAVPLKLASWFLVPLVLGTGMLGWAVILLLMWAGTAGLVKRLHDLDYSASFVLGGIALGAVAGAMSVVAPAFGRIVGLVAMVWFSGLSFVAYFVRGTKGDNRFGADPLEDI